MNFVLHFSCKNGTSGDKVVRIGSELAINYAVL